ncbi:MAG: hypothetical protein K8R99_07610 [Actinomycetia bacterium]|nr:hypothetical protein [Actinomycetes bacterium]
MNTTPEGGVRPAWLLAMDGGWFRAIALDWYDRHGDVGGIGEYPFFPLFPSAGGALMRLGLPSTVALAGLAWAAALAAMAGARLLAARHLGDGAARLTPWLIALAPGSLSLILGYADAFYLAAIIWAVVAADQRRWWLAGVLAAAATASRPNGLIAVVAVVMVAIALKASRRQVLALTLPSLAFLAAWMTYLGATTGEPLLFWTAKAEWLETTFFEFVSHPLVQRLALFHVIFGAILLAPFLFRIRRQPPAWSAVVFLGVAPALALGVIGTARYAVLAFPLPIVAAQALSERPRWVQVLTLVASAVALMVFSRLVVVRYWVP